MYSIIINMVKAYLNNNGYVNYRIACHLIRNGIAPQIFEKSEHPNIGYWADICMKRLRDSCKIRNPKYRRAVGNERPGVYLIDMPSCKEDGPNKG